jgi:hypothetical protein
MTTSTLAISIRPGSPDFLDLPWDYPFLQWSERCTRLEEVPRGLSRHPVVFVNYSGSLFALKELPSGVAAEEYDLLREINELHLPAVRPIGHADLTNPWGHTSVLITQYLDYSVPYRSLVIQSGPAMLQDKLLDAMAGLLVQLHLAGVYWGDCSLSNTLFRRDAGMLQAYLVDAETAQVHPHITPSLRHDDLEIMEENINGDLADLVVSELLPASFPVFDTGTSIRKRYKGLWEEITREEIIAPNERFRIQERIRALNALGFSVGELEIRTTENGEKLSMRALVTDRNFHRDQLHSLTGVVTEEMQARKLMNEIQELKASLSKEHNRSTPMSAAAFQWLERLYQPAIQRLQPVIKRRSADPAEIYCELLEHKWYLSEKAQRDVGHNHAIQDYLDRFMTRDPDELPGK